MWLKKISKEDADKLGQEAIIIQTLKGDLLVVTTTGMAGREEVLYTWDLGYFEEEERF